MLPVFLAGFLAFFLSPPFLLDPLPLELLLEEEEELLLLEDELLLLELLLLLLLLLEELDLSASASFSASI